MKDRIQNYLRRRVPHRTVVHAFTKALVGRHKLPPGNMARLDFEEKQNRLYLLERATQLGPVFKGTIYGEFAVCVIGLANGRRLLRDHGDDLKPMTLKLETLFPKGFLRQMEGDNHRHYRKALMQAIQPDDYNAKNLGIIAAKKLADYAVEQNRPDCSPKTYIAALNKIASGMLMQIFFGLVPGMADFDRILKSYDKIGPHGLVWDLGEVQKLGFVEIRDQLLGLYGGTPANRPAGAVPSIISRLADQMTLDETMLGNLIYMVEMGRYDTYSLFRWLTKFAAENPVMVERIAHESAAGSTAEKSFTEAFVLETLRMAQAERLSRRVKRDFTFDGHFIPKATFLRICLWESHKLAESFSNPLTFNPERFFTNPPGREVYAPFGLDQHQCPFADATTQMAIIYLRELARGYTVQPIADGASVRGAHHWEPASTFGVRLQSR